MASVEERLEKVEKEIMELKAKSADQSSMIGWLKRVEGSFKGDPDFQEIIKLGKEIRDADKPKE